MTSPTKTGQGVADLEDEAMELESLLWENLSTEKWMRAVDRLGEIRAELAALESSGQPGSHLQVKGKTMEDAVARWNKRVAP